MGMPDTIWRNKHPGQLGSRVEEVSEELGVGSQGGVLLTHSGVPDWVRHPDTGQQLRVLAMSAQDFRCPVCGDVHIKKCLRLESKGPNRLYVLECKACNKFHWFEIPAADVDAD